MDRDLLIDKAIKARNNSYCPYSEYSVGAALLCSDGKIVTGSNIENASYGGTVCAERTAIFKAVSEGLYDFKAIAISGGRKCSKSDDYAFPCGICRQVMREFTNPKEFVVIVAKDLDDYKEFYLEELLPNSFGPDNLK